MNIQLSSALEQILMQKNTFKIRYKIPEIP